MMQPFFETVPPSLEEAALVDGAPIRTVFLRIVLPMVAPGIAATAILCFLYAWNHFFFALILTRTNARTAPVAVVNFMNYEGWEWGKIAAGGSLVVAPVLIFSLAVRRYLVSGLTAGAVEGWATSFQPVRRASFSSWRILPVHRATTRLTSGTAGSTG